MATQKAILQAWEKAQPVRGEDPNLFRRDDHGNLIRAASYGTHGEYGWEVDHKVPVSKGGSENPRNLRALHWEANREKSDKHPHH